VDLNADLGEGFGMWRLGDDEALLDVITSANVACGFHAGDARTMRRVCAVAGSVGVTIGAQVGYRDLPGFGRRRIEYDPDELRDEVLYQLAALDGFARVAGTRVKYVKPHGALYHSVVTDPGQAGAVVAAVVEYDLTLAVLGLPGSRLLHLAERAGLRAVPEGFADRGYLPGGGLVPRSGAGSVLTGRDEVVSRAVRMATAREVVAVDGTVVRTEVESLCVHGDTPGAAALAHAIRSGLSEAGVPVAAFAR
jgi:5-oxoprolinase (ATP-hydrolysing) subunit A